ncbi:MAG: M48 family metallopeptidase [Sandaracinaceae bacterium]
MERDPHFDFQSFVELERSGAWGRDEGVRYAYSADIKMMRGFSRLRPVELAAASIVRTSKEWMRAQLLGSTVRVGPKQFPSIQKIAEECAKTLTVPTPTIYIQNSPVPNAFTYGTEHDSFIVITSALIDHFDESELRFVIGHETGHIQNKHVVYSTVLSVLTQGAGIYLAWLAQPALIALRSWYRRAEITCDRAGLLCNQDLEAASRSFMKLASGSQKLYGEMNIDAFLDQFEESQASLGRMGEAFQTHPYVPKRIHALRVFADSELYRSVNGGDGGLDMDEVDRRTSEIIQITKAATPQAPASLSSEGLLSSEGDGVGGKDHETE